MARKGSTANMSSVEGDDLATGTSLGCETSSVLYARILGSSWLDLAPCIQRLHTTFSPNALRGRFEIRRGKRWAPRACAEWLRLPGEASSVDVQLVVEQRRRDEMWVRQFGKVRIITTQWRSEEGLLWERFGKIELGFRLGLDDGQLVYRQQKARLHMGCCSLPLPRWFAPRVSATEKTCGNDVKVSVEVRLPWLGLLVAYDGLVYGNEGLRA